MSTHGNPPEPIQPDLLERLAERAKETGDTINGLLRRFLDESALIREQTINELLDLEYIAVCEADADPTVTLASVHKALSKIPGSMTPDFVAERDDR